MLPDDVRVQSGELQGQYLSTHKDFFTIIALSQAWTLGVDFFWIGSLSIPSYLNIANAVVAIWLSRSAVMSQHVIGTIWIFLAVLGAIVYRGLVAQAAS